MEKFSNLKIGDVVENKEGEYRKMVLAVIPSLENNPLYLFSESWRVTREATEKLENMKHSGHWDGCETAADLDEHKYIKL